MQRTCRNPWCSATFEIATEDLLFYDKVSPVFSVHVKDAGASHVAQKKYQIPPPTHCPECRQQRRLARRNERKFYKRTCDLCGKDIVSIYPTNTPFPVYCYTCWWSDKWDALSYGREVDLSRPFLEQFSGLQHVVPRINLFGKNNENCAYINHSVNSKSCYLCVDVAQTQDTYYSKWMIDCRDCCDCYQLEKSELCYESQYSVNLNSSIYAFLCDKSSNLAFCYACEDCHDCLLGAHLRHKRFCIANEQLTEASYRKRMQEWDFGSHTTFTEALKRYSELWRKTFHRDQQILFSENCSGDFIYHCKNVEDSFGVIESQDCRYCYDAGHMKDCMDAYEPAFDCELQYDSHGCNGGKRLLACHICYDNDSLTYCDFCHNSSHLFGCIGLRRKKCCILNKQYSQDAYEALLPKIIGKMQADGEWGAYFPMHISPFCYNETVAQEYYPLSEKEALAKGFQWRQHVDEVPHVEKVIPAEQLPDSINDIPDDILNWAIRCETTQRPFLLTRQELMFYRKMHIPIPHLHPDERHKRRMAFTNPRKLWQRHCSKCGREIQTTYSSDRPEIVYCEQCYLQAVY